MSAYIVGIVLILWVVFLCIIPFVVPTFLEYYRIYKQVQEPFGLSDFYCFWEAFKDAFCDVFNFQPVDNNDEEVDH